MNTAMDLLTDNYLRNSLIASGNLNSAEQYILPDLIKSTDVENTPKKKNKKPDEFLKVFPNPAKDYVIFEFMLTDDEFLGSASIVLSDSRGIIVDNIQLKRPVDQIVCNTKNLYPGIYICSLVSGANTLLNTKLSIIK
jgi:hypothetical protein